MTARRFPIQCTADGCPNEAQFKIAAEWSDGSIRELKTYGLACDAHLDLLFRRGCEKQGRCRLTEGETLTTPRIFRIESGQRDQQLVRLEEIEAKLQS